MQHWFDVKGRRRYIYSTCVNVYIYIWNMYILIIFIYIYISVYVFFLLNVCFPTMAGNVSYLITLLDVPGSRPWKTQNPESTGSNQKAIAQPF